MFNLVSHKFGYGLMDGGALVTMAEQWSNVPPQRICRASEDNKQRYTQIFNSYLYQHILLSFILM